MPGQPLISIVIPVYNIAGYLSACLDSALGQAGQAGQAAGDVEVIAVDDASSDGSARLLEDRAAADPRLRVVRLERNGGQGAARNAGLAIARGEYVWFVDGDDQVASGALAVLGSRLAPGRASPAGQPTGPTGPTGRDRRPDVLLINWVSSYPNGATAPAPGAGLLARVPADGCTLAQFPRLIDLTMTSWSKVVRRKFLAGLGVDFAAGIHEDVLVTCAELLAARSIAATTAVCYRYRQDRPGSAMVTAGAAHLAIFTAYEKVFDLLAARRAAGDPVSDAVQTAIFQRAIWHYTTVLEAPADAAGPMRPGGRGGLVPPGERRAYFARMHADFAARRPARYRHPPGARGLKFRLIERGWYPAYALLEPVNRLRVAAAGLASRGPGRGRRG